MGIPEAFEAAQRHLQLGQLDACRVLCEEIINSNPSDADALHCIGLVHASQGRPDPAVAALEQALAIRPDTVSWNHDLGVAYGLANRWEEAAEAFANCLSLDPAHPESLGSYPASLLETGHLDEALAAARQALLTVRDSTFLLRTLGRILAAKGCIVEAEQAFEDCLRLAPNNPKSLETAGDFFKECGEESRASELFARLTSVMPDAPRAWLKCAGAYMRAGLLDPALDAARKAIALDPANSHFHSTLLHVSLMDPALDGEKILAAHRHWSLGFNHAARLGPFPNSPDPNRRIRLGILSGELSEGSNNFFLPPLLENLDADQFELFAYSAHAKQDAHTQRYIHLFHHWREVADLPCPEVEAAIRHDAIDILIDVSGHLPHRRLDVFARRAAPVQISYPRYPGPTGLDTMDYRITDHWSDPIGLTEHHYSEKLLRIPSGYLVYQPPDFAPSVSALPALSNGYITFGFFQTPLKLNAGIFEAFAATLLQVPESRLLFHYAVADFDRPGRLARQRIENELALRGIDPARLLFRGPLTLRDHLELVSQTDIALDSTPYTGQTTTCECLWMGVPVVTLAGSRFSGRVSAAILHRTGVSDWVASTESEYPEIAMRKASDLMALSNLRQTLRSQFAASPLLDPARVAREIEAALRIAWRTWCARQLRSGAEFGFGL